MTYTTKKNKSNRRFIAMFLFVIVLTTNHIQTAYAAETASDWIVSTSTNVSTTNPDFAGFSLPEKQTKSTTNVAAGNTMLIDSTAYTSSVEECDSDPFITADGSTTHDGIVAANFLPFGTKIQIPALFGDKIFEVHDRMNTRFNDRSKYLPRVDVWMADKNDMRQYGIHKRVTLVVVQMGNGETQWHKKK